MQIRSLNDRIAAAYRGNAPTETVAYLIGRPSLQGRRIHTEIVEEEREALALNRSLQDRARWLADRLRTKQAELAAIAEALDGEKAFEWPADRLGQYHGQRMAVEAVITRIEAAIEENDSKLRDAQAMNADWSALAKLSQCRKASEIPSPTVAALFGVEPAQLVTPEFLALHLAATEQARQAEAKRQEEAEAASAAAIEARDREAREREAARARELAAIEDMSAAQLLAFCFGENPYEYLKDFFFARNRKAAEQARELLEYRLMDHQPEAKRRAYHRLWEQYELLVFGQVQRNYPDVRRKEAIERQEEAERACATWQPPQCTPAQAEMVDRLDKNGLLALLFGETWQQIDCLRNFFSTAQISAAGQAVNLLQQKASGATPVQRRAADRLVRIHDEMNSARQAAAV